MRWTLAALGTYHEGKMRVSMCVLALLIGTAYADDKAVAEAAYQEGRQLAKDGRWAEACPKFEVSQRADPAIGTLLNLADCHEHLGRTASAWAEFREAAEMARKRVDTREEFARQRAGALEPKLVRLRVDGPVPEPPGLVVRRGSSDITGVLGTAVPVDPGEHVVEASAPGYVTWSTTVVVKGEGKTEAVKVPELEKAKETKKPPERKPFVEFDRTAQRKRRTIAVIVGGAGVVALGVGSVFGARAFSQWDDSRAFCDAANVCDADGRDLVDGAKTSALLSDVFIGVGLAGAAAGVVLWITAPPPRHLGPEMQVLPVIGPDGAGAMVRGTF